MKIENIRAQCFKVPVHIPLIERPIQRTPVLVSTVTFEGGLVGRGFASHYFLRAAKDLLENDILTAVKGLDARNTEQVHDTVGKKLNARMATGAITNALSALDIAIWDAMGKAQNRSVASLLGGAATEAEVYVTFGFPDYNKEQLVEAAKMFADQGIRRLKMVVAQSKGGWMEDARRVRAVRDAIGDDIGLMIDANLMFNPAEALSLCAAVSDCSLTWFEEPMAANNPQYLRELRQRTNIPIAAGQNLGNRQAHFALVEGRAVDILQPHALFAGGFSEVRKIAHMAQCADITIANGGGWPHVNMHAIAGLSNGWLVEYHLGHAEIGELLLQNAPRPEGGRIRLPDAPGLGLREDLSDLEEFADSD